DVVILNGNGANLVGFGGGVRYVEVTGLILDGINLSDPNGLIVSLFASFIRFRNNEIKNCPQSCVQTHWYGAEGGANQFIGNTVHHNGLSGYQLSNAFYIMTSDNIADGNKIFDVFGIGIRFMDSGGAPTKRNIARYNIISDYSKGGEAGGNG